MRLSKSLSLVFLGVGFFCKPIPFNRMVGSWERKKEIEIEIESLSFPSLLSIHDSTWVPLDFDYDAQVKLIKIRNAWTI